MKDEVVSYTLDPKNFSPAFLVMEEHAHYMNMCAVEIFTHMYFDILMHNYVQRNFTSAPCSGTHPGFHFVIIYYQKFSQY